MENVLQFIIQGAKLQLFFESGKFLTEKKYFFKTIAYMHNFS